MYPEINHLPFKYLKGVALSTFIPARVNESYNLQHAQEILLLLESFTYNLNGTLQIQELCPCKLGFSRPHLNLVVYICLLNGNRSKCILIYSGNRESWLMTGQISRSNGAALIWAILRLVYQASAPFQEALKLMRWLSSIWMPTHDCRLKLEWQSKTSCILFEVVSTGNVWFLNWELWCKKTLCATQQVNWKEMSRSW